MRIQTAASHVVTAGWQAARKALRALAALLLPVVVAMPPAHALGGVAHLTDYHHTTWGAQQGAPGDIGTMTQTRDGWLWLGTSHGLFRFDGARFEKFAPQSGPQLLSPSISNVWAADNGDLWIGYHFGGMSILHDGRLRHIAGQEKGAPVGATYLMDMDRDGSMWVAATNGLRHYTCGKWESIGPASGFPGPNADSIFIDHDDRVWVSNEKHIYQLDRATGKFVDSGIDGTVDNMAESADGRLWLGEKTDWRVLPAPATGRTPKPASFWLHTGRADGMFDRDGNHWQLRCPVGVCRTAGTPAGDVTRFTAASLAADRFDQPWQMGGLGTQTMLEDREGNVWIGTQAGLERFRYKKLRAVGVPPAETYFKIAKDDRGQAWSTTLPGGLLFRLGETAQPEVDSSHGHLAIGTATDGSLMLADTRQYERRRAGASTYLPMPPGPDGKPVENNFPLFICGDAASPWMGIAFRGMFHLEGGQWVGVGRYGIVPGGTRAVAAGRNGDLWHGNKAGVILHIERSGRWVQMAPSGVGSVTMLEASERLIAGGDQGLAFWKDGSFHLVRATDAEAFKGISGMAVDAAGDRWFNGSKGVVHVRAADWAAVLKRPDQALRYELLDALDGYAGSAQTMNLGNSVLQDGDGRMYFVGSGGIVSIAPGQIRRNTLPPPVVLTRLHTDAADYSTAPGHSLPAGTSAVRLDYTALSYAMPERLRFDYKLDGVDQRWFNAGTAREASYRQLGPGTYRFLVRATNEEGIASQGDAGMTFSIQPTFVQTVWCKLLVAAAVCALMYAAYAWRLHRLAHYYDTQMRTRLAERERIARELHDTLLQSVQGLVLKVHGTSQRMPAQDPLRGMLDDAVAQAETTIADGRRRVQDLRTHEDGSHLLPLLQASGDEWAHDNGTRFTAGIAGEQRLLAAGIGSEIVAVCREAMSNAFRHAQAGHVDVTIQYGASAMIVTVADDGIGIDADTMEQGGRDGHFGLVGMRERAGRLGGRLAIAPRPDGGTACVLTLPAALAYAVRKKRWWR
jgi:signal transduction histidine kinase/ligand-binding sensor domain-containing protein